MKRRTYPDRRGVKRCSVVPAHVFCSGTKFSTVRSKWWGKAVERLVFHAWVVTDRRLSCKHLRFNVRLVQECVFFLTVVGVIS